jgi:hypothetical protein
VIVDRLPGTANVAPVPGRQVIDVVEAVGRDAAQAELSA